MSDMSTAWENNRSIAALELSSTSGAAFSQCTTDPEIGRMIAERMNSDPVWVEYDRQYREFMRTLANLPDTPPEGWRP